MTRDQKTKILKLRARHYTIYEIADQLEVLPQSVHAYLKKLPVKIVVEKNYPLPKSFQGQEEIMDTIIDMYMDGRTFESISELTGYRIAEIEGLLCYIKSRFNHRVQSDAYPELAKFINENNMTVKEFSEIVNMSCKTFSQQLTGKSKKRFPERVEDQIQKILEPQN